MKRNLAIAAAAITLAAVATGCAQQVPPVMAPQPVAMAQPMNSCKGRAGCKGMAACKTVMPVQTTGQCGN